MILEQRKLRLHYNGNPCYANTGYGNGISPVDYNMGMYDSLLPLIIPSIASPAVFYFMYSYLQSSLPLSLVEAARIDGSGEFRTFNRIVLPIMKPAIAVQAIFTFVSS